MAVSTVPRVVGVRFQKIGKLYHFDATDFPEIGPGDFVIVETRRGRQLGQVMGQVPQEQVEEKTLKPVKRPASARDLMMSRLWEAKQVEALITCREQAAALGGLDGVKFVKAQYNYDGSLLSLLYTAEEDNPNTNALRKRMERELRARVEMRRIGARDAAKLLGEYGACGAPRCCSTFLTDFSPISIKMAKAQGISLNPSEITGMCGRLRCCLIYEYEQYVEATKNLPRRNKWIGTPHGEGKVIDRNPLEQTVTVIVEEKRYQVHRDDLVPLEELRALQEKARSGCAREGMTGPCECGARTRSGKPPEEQSGTETQEPGTPPKRKRRRRGRRRPGSGDTRSNSGPTAM
jgi:cell fate regulator YaaT (PSP1 superfamily)